MIKSQIIERNDKVIDKVGLKYSWTWTKLKGTVDQSSEQARRILHFAARQVKEEKESVPCCSTTAVIQYI